MVVRVDAGRDTNVRTARAIGKGLPLAPGSLFSSSRLQTTRMRLNAATMQEPTAWAFLQRGLGR